MLGTQLEDPDARLGEAEREVADAPFVCGLEGEPSGRVGLDGSDVRLPGQDLPRALVFEAAGEAAVGELSLALTESGALVLELVPRQATLEDLFFRLTEDGATATAEAAAAKRDEVTA